MLIESLERRQLLSASAVFVPCSGTLVIAYSSGSPANQLNVFEGAAIQASSNPAAANNANPGTVLAVDTQSGIDVPVNDGTHPDGVYTGVKHIIIIGGSGDDNISYTGSELGAEIFGNDGNDTISVADGIFVDPSISGHSIVHGGNGNDTIILGNTNGTSVYGDNGDDTLIVQGFGEADFIDAGNGNDTIVIQGNLDNSTILGGNGSDTIINESVLTNDYVNGGNGPDTFQNLVDAVNIQGTQILSAQISQA